MIAMNRNRMLASVGLAAAALVGLLAGCQSTSITSVDKRTADPNVEHAPQTATADASPTNPIQQYKQKVLREAMQGLRYDTGRVRIDSEHPRNLEGVGTLEAARAKYRQGEFDLAYYNNFLGAIRKFSDAVIIKPDEPTFYLGLGKALEYKGRPEQAEAAYRTALDLNPELVEAHALLAANLYAAGKYQNAIDEWNLVVSLDPNNGEAHGRLALAYYYQNNYALSQEHLEQADRLGYDGIPPQFRPLLASHAGR